MSSGRQRREQGMGQRTAVNIRIAETGRPRYDLVEDPLPQRLVGVIVKILAARDGAAVALLGADAVVVAVDRGLGAGRVLRALELVVVN